MRSTKKRTKPDKKPRKRKTLLPRRSSWRKCLRLGRRPSRLQLMPPSKRKNPKINRRKPPEKKNTKRTSLPKIKPPLNS